MFTLSLLFTVVLSAALVVVYAITSYITYSPSSEKLSAFECGFDPLSKMRSPFSTRFFLLVVLFLIFDVEIALLFPVLSALSGKTSILLLSSVGVFLMILLIGMFHEWNEGALDWIGS
uniref:NADH dehydrogenase subunit 3 n=1 Tax=Facelina bostoniensis TaxID=219665 RepID=UPI00257ED5ED|nr:NADH dehydrogenase subunit 3 [Facelina bostoniensis]WGV42887.1 NADH dehydrogenase subunit 3 [Facelina bostoniensis]